VLLVAVIYLRVGTFDDPVISLAPIPEIDLPTKKPAKPPIPLERVHILNPTPPEKRESLPATLQPSDAGAASYPELRRQFFKAD
jgi:hypothetical protein